VQQRRELRQDGAGDDFRAFGGGMDAVLLDGSGDVDQVFVDHGDECDPMFRGEVAEDIVKRPDVVRAVIGRQRDAGQKNIDVRGVQGGEDGVQVLPGLIGR